MEKIKTEVLCHFSNELRKQILDVLEARNNKQSGDAGLEEICLRAEKSTILMGNKFEEVLRAPSKTEIEYIVSSISQKSLYAYEKEIADGYITLKGGHRVGVCGRAVCEQGHIKTIRNISALNFRIVGAGYKKSFRFKEHLKLKDGHVGNTLIVSPPKCGKTTLLRELTRSISDGICFKPEKVSLIDERSEIAACMEGISQYDVGVRTDVLDACPKQQGIYMMLRSMAPGVIVCDEIGNNGDCMALLSAVNAGVKVIASAHGASIDDLRNRVETRKIVDSGMFDYVVVMDKFHFSKIHNRAGEVVFDETDNQG